MRSTAVLALLLGVLIAAGLAGAAKRSQSAASGASSASQGGARPRATTTTTSTTTPSSIVPDDWRDPYVYSLFEITLSAIDSKLRRVDNLERSMELLMAKMADSTARSDAILAKLSHMDGRINRLAAVASGAAAAAAAANSGSPATSSTSFASVPEAYSLEPRILALDEKVSEIGTKLNVLTYQLDSNSLLWAGLSALNGNNETSSREDFTVSGSEQSRTYATPPSRTEKNDRSSDQWKQQQQQQDDGESLKSTMASMDRHLKILIELFSEQMDKMMGAVADVRTAVAIETTTAQPAHQQNKLDQIYQKMTPLLDVSDKMDQVWNVLLGAKNSVDSLVPTSEALLWQTQRHERALSDMHTEMNVKTKQIIDQLNQLATGSGAVIERVATTGASPSTKRFKNTEALDSGHNKAQESQHVITFKQTTSTSGAPEQPQSRTVPSSIRVQELSPGPVVAAVLAAAKSTTPATTTQATTTTSTPLPPLPEVVPIPSDIMDSEFLHDEPSVGPVGNSTTSTSSSSSSTKKSDTDKTLSTTSRTVSSQSAIPAGPTERSRIPSNSAVIFPSVKNKPGFTNSTFFYDYTAPQNIRGYSCAELKEQGLTKSGIYYLLIRGTTFWYIKVYCDMETANGGWTVIQRRDDYGGDNRENFNRDWDDYKSGFGDPDREFWLGNENIYMLTNAEDYSLRVELEDFEGNKRYAEYSSFKLYSEREQYKLEIGGYTGNAGDSLNDPWYGSNLSPFSTYNRDNDRSSLNCASMLKGGWWWKSCGRGLNGIYLTDPQDLTARQGIVWFRWRGWDYTLKRATMMIRPRHYGKEPTTQSPQQQS